MFLVSFRKAVPYQLQFHPADLQPVLVFLVVGLTASFFGLGATLSNFLGQLVVEKLGHVASLSGSFCISFVPILLFLFMPETLGQRGHGQYHKPKQTAAEAEAYKSMA